MATNEITCRVTLESSIAARVSLEGELAAKTTLGVPVEVPVEHPTYDGENVVVPGDIDAILHTAGLLMPSDIRVRAIKRGSFVAKATTPAYTLDTGSTDWWYLVIIPHVYPYETTAARCIGAKIVDLRSGHLISVFGSSAGSNDRVTAASDRAIGGTECNVEDGVVTFGGAQATVGRFVEGCRYDWYAWGDGNVSHSSVYEGSFMATETGVLEVDTGYRGDGYPKVIEIVPQDEAFFEHPLHHAVRTYVGTKKNGGAPAYAGGATADTVNVAYNYTNDTGVEIVGNYLNSVRMFGQDMPTYAGAKLLRCPDNHTLRLWCASENSSTSTFFPTNVWFTYRVIY